jgi:hypothetical protein
MKKPALLAALALGIALIPQTSAWTNPCGSCAIQQPGIDPIITPEEPADGTNCSGCALPTLARQRLAEERRYAPYPRRRWHCRLPRYETDGGEFRQPRRCYYY